MKHKLNMYSKKQGYSRDSRANNNERLFAGRMSNPNR